MSKEPAAVLINMHIWQSSTFREICMFSFGKNLAQALMKYSPIDPPAAAPSSTYGHCSTPSPAHTVVLSFSFKSSHTLEGDTRGTGESCVYLCTVCHFSSAKVQVSPEELPESCCFRGQWTERTFKQIL